MNNKSLYSYNADCERKGEKYMANKNKLSIYLVKSNIEDVEDIFENHDKISELEKYPDGSVAYFVPSYVHEPAWLSSFFHCPGNDLLK